MKRKITALALCVLLTLGLCLPAFAEEATADQELASVTLAVKKTLSIGNDYENFSGNLRDLGALRYWQLEWSDKDGGGLSVTAGKSGKVMQYRLNSAASPRASYGGFEPSFSKTTADQARKTAEAFLGLVLTGGESGSITADRGSGLNGSDYYYTAQILLGGVPSANTARLQIDSTTGKVTYYARDDLYSAYMNALPSATPAVPSAEANKALSGAVVLTLQYVADGKGAAVLRYVPTVNGSLYVDAQTGKLTDMDDAWKNVRYDGLNGVTEAAATEDKASGNGLSDAEQAAVTQLKDVLTKEQLDAAARKITALGLSRYRLSSADYMVTKSDGSITCTLRYARPLALSELSGVSASDYTEGKYQQTRYLTLDAKTGKLLSGWSYRSWNLKDTPVNRGNLQGKADAFLAYWQPSRAAQTALTDGDGTEFRYDRSVNGYFYHDNSVSIDLDPTDGSVLGFRCDWDDTLSFQSADGLISADAAKNSFCAAWKPVLRYLAYPVSVDVSDPVWAVFAENCGSVAYRYVLGYTYESDGRTITGVDAKTGKLVYDTANSAPAAYTDISGSYAKKQIAALAENGIRFGASSSFRPTAKLTEQEMLVFLLNAAGWSFDTADLTNESTLQNLYQAAWGIGLLPTGQKHPTAQVTRLELVRALISASPYGKAAELKNIFRTSFSDTAQIPAKDLGYVAIAEGLGLVRGNVKHQFSPSTAATRQEAAAILFNYMNR